MQNMVLGSLSATKPLRSCHLSTVSSQTQIFQLTKTVGIFHVRDLEKEEQRKYYLFPLLFTTDFWFDTFLLSLKHY